MLYKGKKNNWGIIITSYDLSEVCFVDFIKFANIILYIPLSSRKKKKTTLSFSTFCSNQRSTLKITLSSFSEKNILSTFFSQLQNVVELN